MTQYYSVAEIETATVNLAAAFPSMARLIALPNITVEGRTSHALHLSTDFNAKKRVWMVTAGVHAAEWGSCEIVLNLATDLLKARSANLGLSYGGKKFTKKQINSLFDGLDIVIFPLVNPDGRQFSRTAIGQSQWRKNRNVAFSDGDLDSIGVDINRNFDLLFDLNAFAAGSAVSASDDPKHSTFHGPNAASETETRNVVWLLDEFDATSWFVDVHSPGQCISYVWGDDDAQSTDRTMNFMNSDYDGLRGESSSGYGEYCPRDDIEMLENLAQCFAVDLFAVAQTSYDVRPAFALTPYSGTSHDYAYSRHLADESKSKVFAFFVEWGDATCQPDWADMEDIIKDVTAGLIGFGLVASSN